MGAGAGEAHLLVSHIHILVLPGDAPAGDFQCAHLPGDFTPLFQGLFADKVGLFHLDAEAQASFDGGDGVIHLMAVQRHACFEAQRIPAAQAAGEQAEFLAGLQQRIPDMGGVCRCAIDLITELTGVAGAGNQTFLPRHGALGHKGIILGGQGALVGQLADDVQGFGALEGYLGHIVGNVFEFHIAEEMVTDPFHILCMVGRINHQQDMLFIHLINQQVIHGGAVFIAHGGIFYLTIHHVAALVGHQHLHIGHGVLAAQGHFRHVGHIEQTGLLTHGHMLGDDAGLILYRQQKAGKGNDLAFGRQMAVIQGGFLFHRDLLLSF